MSKYFLKRLPKYLKDYFLRLDGVFMNWEEKYAKRARGMRASAIRELLKLTQQPDIISFGGGLPSPDAFPVEIIKKVTLEVLTREPEKALQYGTTEGDPNLRRFIAERMAKFGIKTGPDNVLITSGSQQGLDLIGKILFDEGDIVIIEAPSYIGGLQAFRAYMPKFLSIPMDDNGMIMDSLEEKLKTLDSSPKLIYTVPTFQNPAGVTMSVERRKKLVEISNRYQVPVLEDDPYGELRYSGETLPAIKSFDTEENVIYMGTFSKIFAPGMRLAWIIGDTDFIRKCVIAKQGTDLCTNPFTQKLAYEYCSKYLDEHIKRIKDLYAAKRITMLEAFDQYMPPGVKWTRPEGGMFLWVTLPEGLNATELLPRAVERKVAYVGGEGFYDGGGERNMRINFSYSSHEQIREGVRILAEIIKEAMAKR
jgi:2-aminoadipate transaminase